LESDDRTSEEGLKNKSKKLDLNQSGENKKIMNNDRNALSKLKKEIAELRDQVISKDEKILEQANDIARFEQSKKDADEILKAKDNSYDKIVNDINATVGSAVVKAIEDEQRT